MPVRPKVVIDKEFKAMMIPQSKEERALLRAELNKDGCCRDKLVVWKGTRIVLDGHNRHEICEEDELSYEIEEIELADRDAARAWIVNNQMARRNLPPEAVAYLRGQHYNTEKQPHGGDRKSEEESSGNDCHLKSDERLAALYHVAARSIRNDGTFAEHLDSITANCDDTFKNALLRREVRLTRGQVKELAGMNKAAQKKLVPKIIESGRWPSNQDGSDDAKDSKRDDKSKVTVPTAPQELVKSLMKLKGASYLERIMQALELALKEHAEKNKEEK